jgi:hypothetical protein
MCTVTIVPCGDGGVRVMCNRDERATRPAATAPRLHRLKRRTAVFPVDPISGGTWIGANDAGLTLALLNRHARESRQRHPGPVSRGLIIPMLLEQGDLDTALAVGCTLDPAAFEPFQLVAIYRGRLGVLTGDGVGLTTRLRSVRRPLLFTSSSLGDARVERPRRRLFQRLVLKDAQGWLRGQFRFHRHHWPASPELSVRMQRGDAMTVSRSVVDVTPRTVYVSYEPLLQGMPRDQTISSVPGA